MTQLPNLHSRKYYLTAAQCNAQHELAPGQLIQQIIEVATEHADILGVGFRALQSNDNIWVLSRITFELNRYPKMFETYSLNTWIESYNRHFSERNFELRTEDGEILGYARSIWVAINQQTRRPADLTEFAHLATTVIDRPCPIDKQGKIRIPAEEPQIANSYTFRVSDIDLNRHVNSARYVELILNQLELSDYDENHLKRFEIEYKQEAHYGNTVDVTSTQTDNGLLTAISNNGGTICLSRSILVKRNN